jgi:Holliday junction resolvase RusA-like endonuclease
VVKWCFPRGRHKDGQYKITKPDTDNLDKMLKDVMTEVGFWKDDAQVASEIIEKFWADVPGIYVEIYELEVSK